MRQRRPSINSAHFPCPHCGNNLAYGWERRNTWFMYLTMGINKLGFEFDKVCCSKCKNVYFINVIQKLGGL